MIININELLRSGKDEQSFFFTYTPSGRLIDIPKAEIEMPIKVNGKVSLTGQHSAIVTGEVVFTIKGECTRCLKETVREFVAEFDEECRKDSENGYDVVCDKIDLGKIVDDTIAMNIPVSFLCKDDCKGICLKCGVNLNDEPCKCDK